MMLYSKSTAVFGTLDRYIAINNPLLHKNIHQQRIFVSSIDEYNQLHDKTQFLIDNKIDCVWLHEFYHWSSLPANLDQLPVKAFVFYFDFNQFNNVANSTYYYPYWFFNLDSSQKPNIDTVTTQYPLAMASRNYNNGRPGKIYNYIKLKEKDYFDQIYITKYRLPTPFEMFYIDRNDNELVQAAIALAAEYETWPMIHDHESHESNLNISTHTIDLDVYKNSLFQLVAETRMQEPLLSEKTFKPFLAGQIPIMCGPMGSVAHLRLLGFDMFDDIVDHAHYDHCNDWKTRIKLMHEVLDQVVNLDQDKLLVETKSRRLYNQQQLQSKDLIDSLLKPIVNDLAKYFT